MLLDPDRLRVVIATPLPPELCEHLTALEPRIDLVVDQALLPPTRSPADYDGVPGFRRTPAQQQQFDALVDSAQALYGIPDVKPAALARTVAVNPDLQWVHTMAAGGGAGVKAANLTSEQLDRVTFTTSAGVHAKPLAEFALLGLLAGAKNLPRLLTDQQNRRWPDRWFMRQLSDLTVLILGLGGIGSEIAHQLHTLGATVIGTSRTGHSAPGVDRVIDGSELAETLPEVDAVVVTLPGTDATTNLLSNAEFAAMRPGTIVVNVGRGTVIDEPALLTALDDNTVAFAALDVTATEPLEPTSPLWDHPKVLISPHTAAQNPTEQLLITELFAGNATALLDGKPLLNVVNTVEFY